MPTPITLKFDVELDYHKRQADVVARVSAGRTSIRVSKTTLAALRELTKKVKAVATEGRTDGWWFAEPSPDALLLAIARGHVRRSVTVPAEPVLKRIVAAAKKAQRKKRQVKRHASKRSLKGMRRRPPASTRKRHASSRGRKVRR